MNLSLDFKKFHDKILKHMKTFNVTIDHILFHLIGNKLGLYVSFQIPLYFSNCENTRGLVYNNPPSISLDITSALKLLAIFRVGFYQVLLYFSFVQLWNPHHSTVCEAFHCALNEKSLQLKCSTGSAMAILIIWLLKRLNCFQTKRSKAKTI